MIVTAASDLLMTDGFSSLSHRSVARQAGLAVSATSYYFSSLDALLEVAACHVADQWLIAARAKVETLPDALDSVEQVATAIIDVAALAPAGGTATPDDLAVITLYERYLEAGRRPYLQRHIAAYNAEIEALIMSVLDRSTVASAEHARMLLALIDGTVIRSIAEGHSTTVRKSIEGFLRMLNSTDYT